MSEVAIERVRIIALFLLVVSLWQLTKAASPVSWHENIAWGFGTINGWIVIPRLNRLTALGG